MSAASAPLPHQPATGSNSQPTPEQEIVQIEQDLFTAEQLAADAEAKHDNWKQAEKAALEEVYDVWKDKEHRTDLLKPYCDRYQIKWDERMKANRFLPVLIKMFPTTKPDKRAHYSGALAYAWEQKKTKAELGAFFKDNGGVQGTARTYNKIKNQRVAAAQATVASPSASALDNLHVVIQLMLAVTYKAKITKQEVDGKTVERVRSRHFIIRNETASEGNVCGVIETAIGEYTAPAARMTFDQPFPELQGIAYVLTDAQADTFERLYPHHQPWTITADATEVVFEAANGTQIKGSALGPQHEELRTLDQLRNPTERMFATDEQLAGFKGWYQRVTSEAKKQYRRLLAQSQTSHNIAAFVPPQRFVVNANPFQTVFIPRALDFNVHDDLVTLGFNRSRLRFNSTWLLNVVHDMFTTAQRVDVLRERRLLLSHALKLFGHLAGNPASEGAMFYLASTDEAQGAFVCELPLESGKFVVAYPTVLNAEMQQRCILDRIDIARLANTGLRIGGSPSVVQRNSLREEMAEEVSKQFGAYITCYRPADEAKWLKRRAAFAQQLTEWMAKADIHLHLRLSGWTKEDVAAFEADYKGLLADVDDFEGTITEVDGAPLIHNRIECLKAFYASDYDWGIMMDDDAILYDQPQHNSAWDLFPEMAKNGLKEYDGVDVFFPNNPAKRGGGFNAEYAKDPALYAGSHVFKRNADLKGSMFMVRNFRKAGRHEVLPDPSYLLHGEDTLFATEAIKQGCTVMKCWNINLKELISDKDSHFAEDRERRMLEAHKRIAEMYAADGLRMKHPEDPEDKAFEREDFYAKCAPHRPKKWTAAKPQ